MNYSLKKIREEQGFTLVELAVVMIIIGILIGGILKGQEMITNARVTSTIAQMESISAAKNDFQGQFNALPGDFGSASTAIGTCGAIDCVDGDGLGTINVAAGTAPDGEALGFYQHLLGAGYLTGYNGSDVAAFGNALPTAPIGGGFAVGQKGGAAANGLPASRAGVYITLLGAADAISASDDDGPGTGILTPVQGRRVDTKLDDGIPTQGILIGDTVNGCTATDDDGVTTWDGAAQTSCGIAYRI